MSAQYKLSSPSGAHSYQSSAKKAESRKLESESSKKGFSLIELMVVIAIVAILSTVGIVVYSSAQKTGRISKRVQDINALKTALTLYKNATGFYPSHTTANAFTCISGPLAVLSPDYMPVLPNDPLDGSTGVANCYQYASNLTANSTDFKLRTNISIGATGEMNSTAFLQQTSLIDPDRDGTPNDGCAVQTGGIIKGWAIHSGLAALCGTDNSE